MSISLKDQLLALGFKKPDPPQQTERPRHAQNPQGGKRADGRGPRPDGKRPDPRRNDGGRNDGGRNDGARNDGGRRDGRHDGRPKHAHGSQPNTAAPGGAQPNGGQRQGQPRPDGARRDGQHRPKGPRPDAKPRTQEEIDLAKAYAIRAQAEKAERARLEREAQDRAREKKERKQKLATLLADKAQNATDADVPRHFPHGDKIRRVYVTPEQLTRLNGGELGVVQHLGRYLLVEAAVAKAAAEIAPESLVLLPDPNAPVEDDIPPDLIW